MENEIKPMTKKELIKKIEEYKPKYIYQRYNGRINKYEIVDIDKGIYIDVETCMPLDFNRHIPFGKVSENRIDLLEAEDLVLYECININSDKLELDIIKDEVDLQDYKNRFNDNFWKLVSFITKEELNKVINNLED